MSSFPLVPRGPLCSHLAKRGQLGARPSGNGDREASLNPSDGLLCFFLTLKIESSIRHFLQWKVSERGSF